MLSNESLNTAQFHAINYEKLLTRDAVEYEHLSAAVHQDGFFFLDLAGKPTETLLQDWKSVMQVTSEWFDRPLQDKMKFHHGTVLHGYTPIGSYTGVNEGTKDGNETIKVTDDAMRNPALVPEIINQHRELYERFTSAARNVTLQLLSALSDILGLTEMERMELGHRTGYKTSSCLNLIQYVRSEDSEYFGQNQHTDNGTLTFLLSEHPGLQVISKDTGAWELVMPRKDHAIINVADTLRFLSGKRFRSAIHRAVPIWALGQKTRFVTGYFLRAEDDYMLREAEGGPMTAKQWHDTKYVNYKKPHSIQRQNPILLGGMGAMQIAAV